MPAKAADRPTADGPDLSPPAEGELPATHGDAYLAAVLERDHLPALREIAERAAELVAVGIPSTTEDQARAASALQRAVLNLPR